MSSSSRRVGPVSSLAAPVVPVLPATAHCSARTTTLSFPDDVHDLADERSRAALLHSGPAQPAPHATEGRAVTLELRLLRTFVVVAEELHFGHAAARLYISQPALSQQIKALEEQVGMPLFHRGSRGVELTQVGEALLDDARDVLERSARLGESVEALRRGADGTLRLGVAPGVPGHLLPSVVSPLRSAHPDVRVTVRELSTPDQVAALNDGSLDLGLVREPIDDPGLARRCMAVELLGVSVPTGHPLASRDQISLRELEGESFICFPRVWAPSLHDILVRSMLEAGVDAKYEQSEHLSTTQGMVAAGLALTFSAPPWLDGVQGIEWRPLADAQIEIRTSAAWRSTNRSPLLRELVGLLPPDVESVVAARDPTPAVARSRRRTVS